MRQVILEVKGLRVSYGGIQAVKGIDLEINAGELVTLIGANGAGKTTTMKAITGLQRITSGDIRYLGAPIKGLPSYQLVKQGLVMVPEGRGVFARMTIVENLQMGAYLRNDKAEIARDIERMFALFPRLAERARQLAGTMSGGEQQMLAIGRALMSKPKLLLLDEPSLGLAPIIIQQIFDIIEQLRKEGVTVFLVEQNANQALKIADRAYVLENGRVVMQGTGEQLLCDPQVRDAYLGG